MGGAGGEAEAWQPLRDWLAAAVRGPGLARHPAATSIQAAAKIATDYSRAWATLGYTYSSLLQAVQDNEVKFQQKKVSKDTFQKDLWSRLNCKRDKMANNLSLSFLIDRSLEHFKKVSKESTAGEAADKDHDEVIFEAEIARPEQMVVDITLSPDREECLTPASNSSSLGQCPLGSGPSFPLPGRSLPLPGRSLPHLPQQDPGLHRLPGHPLRGWPALPPRSAPPCMLVVAVELHWTGHGLVGTELTEVAARGPAGPALQLAVGGVSEGEAVQQLGRWLAAQLAQHSDKDGLLLAALHRETLLVLLRCLLRLPGPARDRWLSTVRGFCWLEGALRRAELPDCQAEYRLGEWWRRQAGTD